MKTSRTTTIAGGVMALCCLFTPSLTRAVAPPSQGRPVPVYVREAQRELAKHYGSNRIAQRVREVARENAERGAIGAGAASAIVQGIPVVVGNFSNVSHIFTPIQYGANLWAPVPPPGPGNMKSYFTEVSNGQYTIGGSAYGPYTADLTKAQYDNGDNGFGNDFPNNAGGFIWHILQKADTGAITGINFSQYDNDGPDGNPNSGDDDGVVDGIIFICPDGGPEAGGAGGIWAHQGNLAYSAGGTFVTNDGKFGGGFIEINEYVVIAGERGDGSLNQIRPVGTYCHEWCHMLGLPDLYDTDNSTYGVGLWCLMGYGNWGVNWNHTTEDYPIHMSAWCRMDLGWIVPRVITALDSVFLKPDSTFLLWEDAYQGGRYFLVEYRDTTGFDAQLPSDGFLVWHCNDDIFYDNSDEPWRVVDLEEADGLHEIDNKVDPMDIGDMYPWGSFLGFNDATNPNARDVWGNVTGVSIFHYASGPGKTFQLEMIPRTLSGFTVSYVKHAWLSGWGFNSAQTNNGAVRYVAPQAGDLVEVLFGAHVGVAENYTVRIFDNMGAGSPTSPSPAVPYVTVGGAIPAYNSSRYHEIGLTAPHSVNAGDTFVVDVASGPSTFTVPTLYRTPHSQNSWFSSNGAAGSYFPWTDKDVAIRARLNFAAASCPITSNGNVNGDTTRTSADVIYLVNFIFKGGPSPIPCNAAGDVTCDTNVTSADIIYMVNFIFKGGPAPCDVCPLILSGGWSCPLPPTVEPRAKAEPPRQ